MSHPVKSFDLINPVMHRGSMMSQISAKLGDTIEMTPDFVEVIPNPSAKREAFLVPMSNVRKITPVNLEHEAAVAAVVAEDKKKSEVHEAKHSAPKSALKGVEKFVKGPDGKITSIIT